MIRTLRFGTQNNGMTKHESKEAIAAEAAKAHKEFAAFFEGNGFVIKSGESHKSTYERDGSTVALLAGFDGREGPGWRNTAITVEVNFEGQLARLEWDSSLFVELDKYVDSNQVLSSFQPPFLLLRKTRELESGGSLVY